MNLSEIKDKPISDLVDIATELGLQDLGRLKKQEIIFRIFKHKASEGIDIYGGGVLEILNDGFGFLRSPQGSYCAGEDDIYVSPSQIRKFGLRKGDSVAGKIRTPKDKERYFALIQVDTINGEEPAKTKNKILFENLTPLTIYKFASKRGHRFVASFHQSDHVFGYPSLLHDLHSNSFFSKFIGC